MKCIDDELIQRYIDGETNLLETEQIEKHIAVCSPCAGIVEEKKAFANAIKNELQKLGNRFVVVPEFTVPTTRTEARSASSTKLKHPFPEACRRERGLRQAHPRFNLKYIVYAVSAACVAAFMLFVLLPERQEKVEESQILMYSVIKDFDANRPYSQQETSIYMIDGDGKIIDYF